MNMSGWRDYRLRHTLRQGGTSKLSDDLPDDIRKKRAGVFVSLKKDGRLRGCIGTIEPTRSSIGDEIIRNAVSAGTGDPRFSPVTKSELKSLGLQASTY